VAIDYGRTLAGDGIVERDGDDGKKEDGVWA
jgi:hypothetical protein